MKNIIYKTDLKFRLRTIAKRPILFGNGKCFELNEVAVQIWNGMDGMTDVEEIINDLAAEYDCTRERLEKDVCEFIEFLKGIAALEEVV